MGCESRCSLIVWQTVGCASYTHTHLQPCSMTQRQLLLYDTSGTAPWHVWHCSMTSDTALWHCYMTRLTLLCGTSDTAPWHVWHCSMTRLALLHDTSGTAPWHVWHCYMTRLALFRPVVTRHSVCQPARARSNNSRYKKTFARGAPAGNITCRHVGFDACMPEHSSVGYEPGVLVSVHLTHGKIYVHQIRGTEVSHSEVWVGRFLRVLRFPPPIKLTFSSSSSSPPWYDPEALSPNKPITHSEVSYSG